MQDVTLTLPMLPDMELTASKTACAMGEHIRMSQDKIDEVQMAVVEATINAFEHSGAPDRKVSIHFHVFGEDGDDVGLQITVTDTGIGIPDGKIPKPGAWTIRPDRVSPSTRAWMINPDRTSMGFPSF